MSTNGVMERLGPIFLDVFDRERIVLTPDLTARDVDGWDSVANIRLMIAVESEFGIKFDIGEFQEYRNVGDLASGIARLME